MIKKNDTNMRQSISASERLAATLRFLATGMSYEELKFPTAISAQRLGVIIPETCLAIIKCLKEYIKVYKVLRRADKEDKIRHCVKQLAIDWKVPLARLTDEQLRPYRRENNKTSSSSTSVVGSIDEETWEVLDECGSDDCTNEDISLKTSQNSSLQKNIVKYDSSQISLHKGETLHDNYDLTNYKAGIQNTNYSQNHYTQNINLQKTSSNIDTLKDNTLIDSNDNSESSKGKNVFNSCSYSENRKEIVKNTNLAGKVLNDSVLEYEIEEGSCQSKDTSLVGNTLKNSDCKDEILDEESWLDNGSREDLCNGDDSDFESAERGLQEALKLSEEDVTPNSTQPIAKNEISHQSMNSFVHSNEKPDCTNIEQKTSADLDSSTNQEKNWAISDIEICGFSDNQCFDRNDPRKTNVPFSDASNGITITNQAEVDKADRKKMPEIISLQDIKPVSLSEHKVVQTLKNYQKANLSVLKVESAPENINNFHYSWDGNNDAMDKIALPLEAAEDSVVKHKPTLPHSNKCCNHEITITNIIQTNILNKSKDCYNGQHLISQGGIKESMLKMKNSLTEKTQTSSRNVLTYTRKEHEDCFNQTNSNNKVGIESNTLVRNEEGKFSSEENNLVQNWWATYKSTFKNEKISSSFYYPIEILDYDTENWGEIWEETDDQSGLSEKLDNLSDINEETNDPEKAHFKVLLSELEDLKRDKLMASMFLENISERELESSEELSDDENILPTLTTRIHTNAVPSLLVLASNFFHSIITPVEVPFLINTLKERNVDNAPNPVEGGSSIQDNFELMQPPLPSYPPPRTPSPPPLPPLSPEMSSSPIQRPSSPPPFSLPYYLLSEEKLSDLLSKIPLPPPPSGLTTIETKKSTPETFKTLDSPKSSEPLTSPLVSPTLKKEHVFKDLQYSPPAKTSLSMSIHYNIPAQQNMPTLIPKTSKIPALPLLTSELKAVTHAPVLQKSSRLKNSLFCINESPISAISSNFPVPEQTLPPPMSPSRTSPSPKPFSLPSLPRPSLSNDQCSRDQMIIITESHPSMELSENNMATKQKKEDALHSISKRTNLILSRNTLRKKNLCLLKCSKSKFKYGNIKKHFTKKINLMFYSTKSGRSNNQRRNIVFRKHLCLKMRKYTEKWDVLKENYPEELSFLKFDGSVNALLPVVEINGKSKIRHPVLENIEESSVVNNCYSASSNPISNEKLISSEFPSEKNTPSKEDESFIEHSDKTFIFTSETLSVIGQKDIEEVSKRLSVVEEKKEDNVPCPLYALSPEPMLSNNVEVSEISDNGNEDNKFKQFVDESIPGDPVACQYIEDEENIEISFESITHNSTNIHLEEETSLSVAVQPTLAKSPLPMMKVDHDECNDQDILNDLQVSSSDDESEEDYVRPRIINGFGDPFVIPHFLLRNGGINRDNLDSSMELNIKGVKNEFQHLECLSSNLSDESKLFKNEDKKEVSSKHESKNLEPIASKPSPENKDPIVLEMKTIERREEHSSLGNKTNTNINKNLPHMPQSINRIKNKGTHPKKRQKPLKPINHLQNSRNDSGKIKDKFNGFKNKNTSENKNTFNDKNIKRCKPIKLVKTDSTYEIKRNVTENALKNRNDKSISSTSPLNISPKSDSYVRAHKDRNCVAKKDSIDTNLKKEKIIAQSNISLSKTIQKEKSYQPSSIRKRLTSEVENIIPIKRDLCKSLKTQTSMPAKNIHRPLKRTISLPEPSAKIANPVLDTIFKDMDAFPPPKTLIIKEPETQKYVAKAYWCSQSSNPIVPNPTIVRDPPLRDTGLHDQSNFTHADGRSINTHSSERPLDPKKILKRSSSLNSNILKKEEKNINPQFKPNEKIPYCINNMNKKSCRVERSSKYRKQTLSNALLVEKRVKIKTQKISASSTVENNKIKEPLPSMPSIVLTSSSSEQVKHNKSVTFDSLAPPLVEISTAASSLKSDELYKVSCKDKPSIKVSIPIFHYISLNRCHKGEFKEELSSNINKKQTFRDGKDNSHNNEIPNNMESKKSGTCAQIRISLNNQPKEKKVINTNLIPSKREQKMENIDGDTKNLTSLIPSKREQTIQNIVVDNSSPTGTSHVNLPVKTSKHSKATPKELINYSINGLKRLSTDLECERPRKQKKLPSRDYERMELHHSNELDSNIPSTPVCLGKDNVNTAVQFLTETSESNPEHTQSSELRSCNISQVTLTISKECEPLKTTIPNSLPPAERGFEILRDLAYSNDFQISVSKDHSDNRDVTCGKPSDTSCGRISQIESSTLRVKHPSLLQTIPAEDSRAQQLTGRRISVISPEALSSAAQSNEQESVKRHIWYREPENQSIPVKSNSSTEMPAQNPSVKSCETKSYFSSLLKENNNITELSNMFKKSLINGKKEYEQMHDVINCIEIDYNQNKVFIERVKKLPSRDIVELEIKRAEKVYEEKLVERELFIRQTIINLLDYFKGATDYLYLAVYVLLSQKVMSLSNDTTFKNSLFDLLKKWIRNDFNKHVFDQTESAFSDDCGIMQKLLGEIDDFSLFKTNVSISNATPINGREDQEVNFSFNGNNCEGNSTNSSNTPNINKHTVESMEFDFCSDNLLSEDLEPQPSTSASAQITTQTEQFFGPLEQFTNIEVTDRSSVSETSTVVESRVPATVSDVFDNIAQMQDEIMYSNFETQEFLGQPNLGVSMQRTEVNTNQNHNVCNNFVENEAILSFQKCQQEIFSQFDVSNNDISQCALNNDLESQIFMQSSVPQNCSILVNENTKNHYKKTQGLANVCHNTSIPLGQNLQSLRIPSGNNLNSNIHHSRQQIQNETHKTNCLQSKFDKYQNMRQEIKQSAIMNHVTNLYNSRENVLYSEGSNIPRQTLVGNEVLSPSCAQSTGSYNFGIQSGISQRSVTKPSVHHLYPQLQHVQPNEVQRHPNHFSNQNTEIEGAGQRCRTQSSNKEYDPSNHRSGQTFHPQSSFYPVQQPHQVVAQHFSEKNITEQFESGNHNIIKGNNTKNPGSREIENPYPAQHLLNDIPKSSQLYSRQVHKTIQPHLDPQQISFQSKARRRPSQELQRQLSYPLNQFRANTVTSQGNNSHIPRRLSNLEVQHDMSVYVMNHPRPNLNHVSSQMPQNKELDVTPQHIVHRRISNEEMTIQTMNSYQSFQSMETLSNQYPYGQNSNQPSDSRRSSIAIPDPSQQPNTLLIPPNSSSNQVHTASVFSEGNIHLSDMNQPQIREASRNISVDPNMVRINPGMDQNRSQSTEMTEDTEFVIPDEDLNKLMNVLDSGIIRDLIENNKNKSINKDQQDFNRKIAEINNASVLNQTSIINHDGTTKSALQNIDTNQKVIAKAPGDDLYFNGVNITKSQLLKFLAICRDQVVLAGLKEDRMTTFIGDYKTADGRSFTQVELTNLMTGAIAMNGLKITKCRRLNYEDSSNKMLINALKAEFLKDAASCTRISKILRNLAEHDNRDAQQAVQDLEDIGRAIHRKRNKTQREQVTLSEEVIVLDD